MERDPDVLARQQAYNQAGELAIHAVANLGMAAVEHARAMAEQSRGERDSLHANTAATIRDSVQSFEDRMNTEVRAGFHDSAGRLIETLGHPDDKRQALRAFNDKDRFLAANIRESMVIIADRERNTLATLQMRAQEHDSTIKHKVTTLETTARRQTSTIQYLFQYLQNGTHALEALIDSQGASFEALCDNKLRQLLALIESKEVAITASANHQLALLASSVETRRKKRAQREQSSNRTNDRQQYRGHGSSSGNSNEQAQQRTTHADHDPRIKDLMGKTSGTDRRPYEIVLKNIDFHRSNGKTDAEIFRLLMWNFHPDRSEREYSALVAGILSSIYDKPKKRFSI